MLLRCMTHVNVPSMHDAAAYFLPLGIGSLCHFGALWLWVGQSENKNVQHSKVQRQCSARSHVKVWKPAMLKEILLDGPATLEQFDGGQEV